MEFETVERCGRIHVIVNGVESAAYTQRTVWGGWRHFAPDHVGNYSDLQPSLEAIALGMDDWYTILQAAERLVETGVFDEPPSTQMMGIWCREERFPGAMKVRGKGCKGGGGTWRISGAALEMFAAGRRGQ